MEAGDAETFFLGLMAPRALWVGWEGWEGCRRRRRGVSLLGYEWDRSMFYMGYEREGRMGRGMTWRCVADMHCLVRVSWN